jgi:hypothetical protein
VRRFIHSVKNGEELFNYKTAIIMSGIKNNIKPMKSESILFLKRYIWMSDQEQLKNLNKEIYDLNRLR